MSLSGKKIIVGLTGGIACYKVPYLVRALGKAGAEVRVIMTDSATKFITPLTLAATSKNPVHTDMWAEREETAIKHIELARWADLVVIAPATANFIGKIASGISDDLLTTIVCATPAPVMIAAAMNPNMWSNPITQRNAQILTGLGYRIIGPAEGEMAERQFGVGRMLEPEQIFEEITRFFDEQDVRRRLLAGKKIVVTAGPCREAIDPVRFISNRSSGKMGYAIAQAAAEAGGEVVLISGPVNLNPPAGVQFVSIESTRQLYEEVKRRFGHCDCLIMAAAPSDFTPAQPADQKIKRAGGALQLVLQPTTDILKEVGSSRLPGQVLIGFALETDNGEENARKKLAEKHLDLIVLNNPRTPGAGFEHDTNQITLIAPGQPAEDWPLMTKSAIASQLIERIAGMMRDSHSPAEQKYRG